MAKDEKVMIGLLLLAIIALVSLRYIRKDNPPAKASREVGVVGQSISPTPENMNNGYSWMVSSEPYAFFPPIDMFLPTTTVGQGSQTVERPADFVSRWSAWGENDVDTVENVGVISG